MACLSPIFSIRKQRKLLKKQNKLNRANIDVINTEAPWFCFPLLELPPSVLIKIFSILPAKDLLKASESCRMLYELAQHNYVWRKLCKFEWGMKAEEAIMSPNRWKEYYMLRHSAEKEGAFEWDETLPKGHLVSKRYQHTGSVVGKDVYFIGGQELPDRRFDDIYVLHTNTMEMAKVNVTGSMPKFARHTAVPIGERIFLFGGFDGVSQHFHLSIFDTASKAWHNPYVAGECPPSRTNHSATSIDNKMYLFGGMYKDARNKLVFLNDLYELNADTLTWSKLPQYGDVPAPRCGHRMLSLNGMLILFGGGSGEQWDKKYNDVHIYNPATNTWTKPKLTGSAPVCTFTVAFVSGGFFFVFGGQSLSDNNLTNDLYCLDLTSMEWRKMKVKGPTPGARDMSSGNVVDSGMYMFGGYCGIAIDSFHTLKMNKRLRADYKPRSFAMRPFA